MIPDYHYSAADQVLINVFLLGFVNGYKVQTAASIDI